MAKKTILIADDEQNVRTLVNRILGKSYDIVEAKDGEEAVKVAQARKPDIILMDIMMPKMDGYTACATIKTDARLKTIPVVMLTGLGFELNKELAKKLGAEGYITKPFTAEMLKETISPFLSQQQI